MSQQSSSIEILDIVPLKEESQFLKPMRVHYKQSLKDKALAWDCVKVHDCVSILIFNVTRNVLVFVRQFRPAVYLSKLHRLMKDNDKFKTLKEASQSLDVKFGHTLELCAGIIDKEVLTPIQIAQEEIVEETGYNPPISSIQSITSFRSGVGLIGLLQHLYYCEVDDTMRISSGGGVHDESIEVIEMTVEESKKYLYLSDDSMEISTAPSFRFALSWFIYEKYPTLKK